MLSNVFLKTLRDQRRALTWWSIGVVALVLLTMLFYPSMRDMTEFEEMYEKLPEALMKAFVGEFTDFTSPAGFLNTQLFFLMVPLLFLVYGITAASSTIAGEEARGTMDLLLSFPLLRWQVVVQKSGALVAATALLGVAMWLGLAVGALLVGMEISLLHVAAATLNGVLLGLAFGGIALALSCVKGSRGLSLGVTSGLATGGYLLNALAPVVDALHPFQRLSPFYHYLAGDPLTNGISLGNTAVLMGIAAVFFGVAVFAFERRDLVK